MGYYTRYTGYVTGPRELLDQFAEHADLDTTDAQGFVGMEDWLSEFDSLDPMSWYNWREETEELSRRYPHLLFTLHGEGEEAGDIWKAWFRNGKSIKVEAEIVINEPNLDEELPTPDAAQAIEARKAAKRAKLDEEIARLKAERDSL